jgi:Straboviridae polynucleotide kinase
MTDLVITRGLPASGKTTYARDWCAGEDGRVRMNRDDLRWNLFGKYTGLTYLEEEVITKVQHAAVEKLLTSGVSVVVDDTNLKLQHARAWADLAEKCQATFWVINIPTLPDVCIEYDKERELRGERSVGADVIRNMYERYLARGPLEDVKRHEEKVLPTRSYTPDERLPLVWLVDIDGTLAHKGDRSPFDWKRVGEDTPNRDVVKLVIELRDDGLTKIIVVSGRDEVCRPETEKWLRENWIDYEELFMRPEGDFRKDSIVKEEIFFRDIAPKYCVRGVLDDRNQVVAMWRGLGLLCLQVADGNF